MRRIVCQELLFALLVLLLSGVMPVFAADESIDVLGFVEPEKALVSTYRNPHPSSKIAENITVITASDIERLNAHTLAEVLQTVPGIVFDYMRTPATFSGFNVQGAYASSVLVLLDGIRQNSYNAGSAIPILIPVQQIERVEIIKGAASAAWGSALGGVINIITKTPNPDRQMSGMVSGSVGSQFTGDSRAELSGTLDRLGYYLTAGNIRSNGLTPNSATNMNHLHGKLTYRLPGSGTVTLGLSQLGNHHGLDEADMTSSRGIWTHDKNEFHRSSGYFKLNQPLGSELTLDVSGNFLRFDEHFFWGELDNQGGAIFTNDLTERATARDGSARLTWGDGQRNLVTGVEYGHVKSRGGDLLHLPLNYDRSFDHSAIYGNGTWTINQLTILPGFRLDKTGISGDKTSYTLGATYQLAESTTLRGYYADGFNLPLLGYSTDLQRIKTSQLGLESGAIPYLWLKGTWFFNTLRDSQSAMLITTNQDRQGFELEASTTPVYNVSLTSGYTYLYAKNSDTGERLQTDSSQSVPPHLVKLALHYNNSENGLRGVLTGNYAWWNSSPSLPAASNGVIWDLLLNWKLSPVHGLSPELFLSGHNLFNGVQTTNKDLYTNPTRWFEGGLRVNF
ncbi:MAG TPA: TonB-dependent receptor [Desulfuromonadales bacterium]|nr:TonB-dependent receptor [Desulfuromonadales bacterium]